MSKKTPEKPRTIRKLNKRELGGIRAGVDVFKSIDPEKTIARLGTDGQGAEPAKYAPSKLP
jgi:hypothetical protein